MGGILKQPGAFAITPHKVSLCILLKIYAPPAQISVHYPFSSVAQHNRLGLFLLALTKSCDDILEPKLDELIHQLRMMSQNWEASWVIDQLMSRLSSLSSPDDLFNFFSDIRGMLGGPDSGAVEDDQAILDMNSNLGIFLRRCVLAFNLLSFEGVCHLLTNIGIYCKEEFSNCPSYEEHSLDDSSSNLETYSEYENMDLENFVYEKVSEEIEARKEAGEVVPFHLHAPNTLLSLVDGMVVLYLSMGLKLFCGSYKRTEGFDFVPSVGGNGFGRYEIGLLCLGMMHFHFGHPKLALEVLTEAVRVSQQELRLSSHLISDFSYESSAMTIDGAFSTAWLRNLQKPTGSLVLCQENGSGSSSNVSQFIAQPTSIPGSVLQVLGSSYILRATAWELYCSAPLSRINALVHATCFADASSSSDAALTYVKLIQHLAVFKGYKEAFSALKIAEEKFLSVSKSQILLLKLQLLHEHALHRGQLKLAQKLCDELGVLASRVTGVDMELKTEASLRHARTLLAANQFREAAAVAHTLFCMCYKYNLQVENASVLLLLAEIHKKSGNAVLGLPYALASLSFCLSFNLDLLKASATLTLAELWLSLGSSHATRALNLIHGAFPIILGHGGLELRSRAYIVEAKCYLCDSNFNVFEDYEIVINSLRQASEELQLLEFHELAAEAFYLMAMVYDKLGQLEEREEAAASFRKHILALGNPQDENDPLASIF
ncbi:Anaphase-promoting complex subunit 5 [Mucuna pruriens]|uniref:Anaphase-promoting complex subunit 5 n=1 Tax=Mucuna pruriens TaxID=157652 RepID=A0A371H993_MUCPR|nr:Anaphase-promoting complex subunit 5 [Mucuna pruriens]